MHRAVAARETLVEQYIRDIAAYPLISRDEEIALGRRVKEGDRDALDRLVLANLRFVIVVAKKYQHYGVALADLINEGNLGLIRAAHRFDPTRGIRFVSYAIWWIRQAIFQALAEQGQLARVPMSQALEFHRVAKRARSLRRELGREPSAAELAEHLGMRETDVAAALAVARTPLSLDTPHGPDDTRLADHLADVAMPAPDELPLERALADLVRESLSSLKEREALVLNLYFGLDGTEPMNLERIGARLGVSRERVRQLKEKALARLRAGRLGKALAEFYG
ncbi:sigma-70 family RNA polymerase sigma factor [Gemmatirosa kalamazoonensis]|uniref:sigma-70 family RNA polymerase sigma factor n=1 Tax=Gemmatirosa kalamazoonensis TaxID=861299 RepID=UPI00046CED89|nr:RNA polymerase sigma factor RpoD/SigA [Gemmatirosa kalamazoonensis]